MLSKCVHHCLNHCMHKIYSYLVAEDAKAMANAPPSVHVLAHAAGDGFDWENLLVNMSMLTSVVAGASVASIDVCHIVRRRVSHLIARLGGCGMSPASVSPGNHKLKRHSRLDRP